ncbi:MAG: hypothetical protein HQ553_00015 [Chloroflexi bacterium]|nr:hypothetical protein [Chloroflexota bacterium]
MLAKSAQCSERGMATADSTKTPNSTAPKPLGNGAVGYRNNVEFTGELQRVR